MAATPHNLVPPSRMTAGDQAEAALFEAIMEGKIPPGAPLRLQQLATELGMSIMPVRDAVRRLEALGLVDIVAHKGAWVRALTIEDLYDTYFTRVNLECLAVMTAAPRFGADDAREAREALAQYMAARGRGDQIAARNANEAFHFALYRACGSDWLVRSITPAWRNSERYRVESMRDAEHQAARAAEHEPMLEALEAHDGRQAAALLAQHLRSSAELVAKGLLAEGAEQPPELPRLDPLLAGV
jgi:DNA-binding GntR family transcriptional regulator